MTAAKAVPYGDLDYDALWTAAQRFWSRVLRHPDGLCWGWTGSLMTAGYGQMDFQGRKFSAHRFAYLLLVGPLEAGRVVRHLCGNRQCTNPAHLEQGTYLDNYQDMIRGERAAAYGADPYDLCRDGGVDTWWEDILEATSDESQGSQEQTGGAGKAEDAHP